MALAIYHIVVLKALHTLLLDAHSGTQTYLLSSLKRVLKLGCRVAELTEDI